MSIYLSQCLFYFVSAMLFLHSPSLQHLLCVYLQKWTGTWKLETLSRSFHTSTESCRRPRSSPTLANRNASSCKVQQGAKRSFNSDSSLMIVGHDCTVFFSSALLEEERRTNRQQTEESAKQIRFLQSESFNALIFKTTLKSNQYGLMNRFQSRTQIFFSFFFFKNIKNEMKDFIQQKTENMRFF